MRSQWKNVLEVCYTTQYRFVHVAALFSHVLLVQTPLESLGMSWEEFATCWTCTGIISAEDTASHCQNLFVVILPMEHNVRT